MIRRSGHRDRRSGQSLVEFALVLPIFLVIVIGIFDVGRAVFTYNTLTNGVREGARMATVNQDPGTVRSRTIDQAITLGLTNADIEVGYFVDDGSIPVGTHPLPAADAGCSGPVALDCVVVVRATYDWSAITPLIGQLVGPQSFTATSAQPVEFTCPNPTTAAGSCPRQP
jgi:Flp pilus assembly protein TadG